MLNNGNLKNDPNLKSLFDENNEKDCFELLNKNSKEISISLLRHIINDKKCLFECSKHLIRSNHLTSMKNIIKKKGIPVNCESSTLKAIKIYEDYNDNNKKNSSNNDNILIEDNYLYTSTNQHFNNIKNILGKYQSNKSTIIAIKETTSNLNEIIDDILEIKKSFEKFNPLNLNSEENDFSNFIKTLNQLKEKLEKYNNYLKSKKKNK